MTILPAGPTRYLHVIPNDLRDHVRFNTEGPTLTIETEDGQSLRASVVEIRGPSRLVQRLHEPLPSQARVWIETQAELAYT